MNENQKKYAQLVQKQSLPLKLKIKLTERRIKQWVNYHEDNVYISFSGGKDSTVLLHIARNIYPDIPALFIDTGLEYPEIKEFVKTIKNVTTIRPKIPFHKIIEKYGYPVISKEQSQYIHQYRTAKSEKTKKTRIEGNKYGQGKISKKWLYLINAPFKISDKCCYYIKKEPAKRYEKKTNRKPIIGNIANESKKRIQDYLRFGCNAFTAERQISRPLSVWTDDNIWKYLKINNVKYSKIYDMGYDRTGCMFCMFGIHMEKGENRFQRMKKTHPKQYNYCMDILGCREVLKTLNIKTTTAIKPLYESKKGR